MKKCTTCFEIKSLSEFSGSVSSRDGFLHKCKLCMRKYYKKWREKTQPPIRIIKTTCPKKIKKMQKTNEYICNRIKTDELLRLRLNIRTRISNQFRRACRNVYYENKPLEKIIGCSMDFFKDHISSMFADGMSFENYGKWHLDHIYPISKCHTKEEIINNCNYKNYQPLWAIDNIIKSNK